MALLRARSSVIGSAHLTSFKTGEFEWELGAGYVEDNTHRSGAYGRLSVLMRR